MALYIYNGNAHPEVYTFPGQQSGVETAPNLVSINTTKVVVVGTEGTRVIYEKEPGSAPLNTEALERLKQHLRDAMTK